MNLAHKLHIHSLLPSFSLHPLLNNWTESQLWRNQALIWNRKSKVAQTKILTHQGLGRPCTKGRSMSAERWSQVRLLEKGFQRVWREWIPEAVWNGYQRQTDQDRQSLWEKLAASSREVEWGSSSRRGGRGLAQITRAQGREEWDGLSRKTQSKQEEEGSFKWSWGRVDTGY